MSKPAGRKKPLPAVWICRKKRSTMTTSLNASLAAETGKELWKSDYPTGYRDDFGFDEGPRATPAIADGRVYTYGAEGALQCTDLASGKSVWAVNTRKEFQAAKGFFGIACSPLI